MQGNPITKVRQSPTHKWERLDVRDLGEWSFTPHPWRVGDEGEVRPSANQADDHLAFYTARAYTDAEVELEFRWDAPHCGVGIILRAQDPSHYYLVQFPCCAQHFRAKHFWASVSKIDHTGWAEILKMEMIRGVPSELGIWHRARIVQQGSEIMLWVDDRPFPVVHDETYPAGRVGLEAWGVPDCGSFRNVRIRGLETEARPWLATAHLPKNWFNPSPESTYGVCQQIPILARASNGDLLMTFYAGESYGTPGTSVLIRSGDNGRTWSAQERLPDELGRPRLCVTGDGRLMMMTTWKIGTRKTPQAAPIETNEVWLSYSEDNGHTWSPPEQADLGQWPESPATMKLSGTLAVLKDGTMIKALLGGYPWFKLQSDEHLIEPIPGVYPTDGERGANHWGATHILASTIRSTDGGKTWSAPVSLDGPPGSGLNFDLTETSLVQVRDGRVLALIRPIYSPWMWETWSHDGGQSWEPTRRGPFASYGNAVLATKSGALLVSGRFPGLGLHASFDDGITWKHYQIGTDIWAMGDMIEIEPGIVFYVYMDSYLTHLRGQFIRVTHDRLEPVLEMLPVPMR